MMHLLSQAHQQIELERRIHDIGCEEGSTNRGTLVEMRQKFEDLCKYTEGIKNFKWMESEKPKQKRGKLVIEKSNLILEKNIESLKKTINEFHRRLSESERQAREN